jgi:hypothetical protein
MKKAIIVMGVLLACALAVSPIQVTTVTVPEWKVLVVSPEGDPVPGVIVRETWRNYSVERYMSEEDKATDSLGYVTFARRTVTASLFERVMGPIRNFTEQLINAGYGPQCFLLVASRKYVGDLDYAPGKPLPQIMTLRNRPKG